MPPCYTGPSANFGPSGPHASGVRPSPAKLARDVCAGCSDPVTLAKLRAAVTRPGSKCWARKVRASTVLEHRHTALALSCDARNEPPAAKAIWAALHRHLFRDFRASEACRQLPIAEWADPGGQGLPHQIHSLDVYCEVGLHTEHLASLKPLNRRWPVLIGRIFLNRATELSAYINRRR